MPIILGHRVESGKRRNNKMIQSGETEIAKNLRYSENSSQSMPKIMQKQTHIIPQEQFQQTYDSLVIKEQDDQV